MGDEKNACSEGLEEIEPLLSNLKIEDEPKRGGPYNLRPRKPKENGVSNASKKRKVTHKTEREMKTQDMAEEIHSNRFPSLKLTKIKTEKDQDPIDQNSKAFRADTKKTKEIEYPPQSISIKTESHPFSSSYHSADETQLTKAEYESDINSPPNYSQPLQTLLPKDTERARSDDTVNKHREKAQTNQLIPHNPTGELYLPCCLVKKEINSEEDLFSTLHSSRIVDKTGCKFIMAEYNWSEKHLRLVPGLNILATCKNIECTKHLEGVVCPRGWFPERKGYCPLDGEVFNATCPQCKKSIIPDDSLGFGFYNCSFQLTYKLHKQPKHTTEIMKKENTIYFGKYRPLNETLDILQVRMSV